MKKYEKIINFVNKNDGIITRKELLENGVSKYYIEKLIADNILIRTTKGVYIKSNVIEDDYYVFQQRNTKTVFSYNTALYFLNETERTPECMDVTVYSGYNVHRISQKVKVHYIKKEDLYLGAIKIKTPMGFEVISYNLERTLCDIIRTKDTGIDKEQTNKFIQKIFMKKKINFNTLIKYAKKLNCEKKVNEIMEVLI